ncbi:MAG: hypothetical protein ACR2L6_04695 [Gemmatimonadaceae bacterium]
MGTTKIVLGFALAVTIGACASAPKPAPGSLSPDAWGALIHTTDSLANAGRHAAADSTLLAFEQAHAGTRAASEVKFWRALYKLDPRSAASTRAEGRTMMDSYAASPEASWYRAQANVLKHLAREIANAERAADAPVIVAGDTTASGIAGRDRIIRSQRDEIARLNAELERIKRRLAAPTP